MAQKTKERREIISIEFKGHTYSGTLVISGTRKIYFTVEYDGKAESDGRAWGTSSDEQHNMRVTAQSIFLRLIDEADREN